VDIKTKEILALGVTDEKTHDGKMLRKLVNHVLASSNREPNTIKVKSILADDGDYDSNTNFKYLEEKKTGAGIKIRKNSVVWLRNNRLRNKEDYKQKRTY
jgi:uncharacterized protein YwbE